jgi:hypothetical protein
MAVIFIWHDYKTFFEGDMASITLYQLSVQLSFYHAGQWLVDISGGEVGIDMIIDYIEELACYCNLTANISGGNH